MAEVFFKCIIYTAVKCYEYTVLVLNEYEALVNDIDCGKIKFLNTNLSQCHPVHHKSHMDLCSERQ
jgi:hypothetical protein